MKAYTRRISGLIMAALLGLGNFASATDTTNGDPGAVRIVTSEIDNFWHAFDDAQMSNDPALVYATEYLAPGSPGVWGFVPGRIKSPQHLAETVQKYRGYYLAARPLMNKIQAARPRIIADLRRYKKVDPDATFPDLYFVVGALNSGGTSALGIGLIFGAEMNSKPPNLGAIAMPGFNAKVLNDVSTVPPLVAHELTHYNQHDADDVRLLGGVLQEGTADFMSQLVDGASVNADQWAFGCAHEIELWSLFKQQLKSTNENTVKSWLYSYDPGPLGAPPFIGYWIGSRVAQAYYDSHQDKKAAIHAILNVDNYPEFLTLSEYAEHRPACRPEPRVSD